MQTIRMLAHTTPEGHLMLELPTSMKDIDVEVTVTVPPAPEGPLDAKGWPVGFWAKYVGSVPDAPEDPEDLPLDEPDL